MASCSTCSKMILFGGRRLDGLRFCSDDCMAQGHVVVQARAFPDDVVLDSVREVHMGLCPVCGGSGPVDLHTSHEIWSLLLLTSWKSIPRISCRSCGVKRQVSGLFFSLFAGWWGIPWGIFMTPVQIVKNVIGLASPPNPMQPSDGLQTQMRLILAEQVLLGEQERSEA